MPFSFKIPQLNVPRARTNLPPQTAALVLWEFITTNKGKHSVLKSAQQVLRLYQEQNLPWSAKVSYYGDRTSNVVLRGNDAFGHWQESWPLREIEMWASFSKSAPVTSSLQIIQLSCQGHSRLSCHVWPQYMISKGNHVKFTHFVLLPVSEEAKIWLPFFSFNM